MDRVQLLLVGLPIFLFCSDIVNLFTHPPPPPHHHPHHHPHHPHHPPHHHPHHPHHPPHHHPHHQHQSVSSPLLKPAPDFPSQESAGSEGVGFGDTIHISFCSSCSYRGTAVTMKKMLETSFPGVEVILSNHPPTLPKRLLAKVVPVVQFGVIAIVMGGEHIFPRLGFMTPPPWYFSLRTNRFGAIASTWLLGNVVQNFLQSSGAFEVFYNNDLVFSKLKEQRFPGEIELREIITKKLANTRLVDGLGGGLWS